MSCERQHLLGRAEQDASRGMPKTTQVASSCAMVDRAAAAHREQPARAVAAHAGEQARDGRAAPNSAATDSKSTSTDGRQECRSGRVVEPQHAARRRTRCRSGGAP